MTITLHEAVEQLNAMSAEDAKTLLSTYPNIIITPSRVITDRFKTCPIAQHLSTRCEAQVNVYSFGLVELAGSMPIQGEHIAHHIVSLIRVLDYEAVR